MPKRSRKNVSACFERSFHWTIDGEIYGIGRLNCNVWLLASNARIHLDSEIQTSSGNPSRDNDDGWIIEVQAAWQCYARDQ